MPSVKPRLIRDGEVVQLRSVVSVDEYAVHELLFFFDHGLAVLDIVVRLNDGLESSRDAAGEIGSIMGRIEMLIGDINDLNRTVNEDKAGFDLMLDDMAASLDQMSSGTSQLITLLRSVQNTAKANRSAVENGTKQTLDGLIDILEKAADTSGTSGKLKDANEDLRTSVKEELDKIEDRCV